MGIDKDSGKRLVVILVMPGVSLMDVAGPTDVFACATKLLAEGPLGDVGYELQIVSGGSSKEVKTSSGIGITCQERLKTFDQHQNIDTLLVASSTNSPFEAADEAVLRFLKNRYPKVRRLASICVGAFVLAEAGLLDHRRATTHWQHCAELQQRFPDITVEPDAIFVGDGNIYTSAGVSSGMDLALALVEEDHGQELALLTARRMVIYLKRPGNQSQFGSLIYPAKGVSEPIAKLKQWLALNLKNELTVEIMANQVCMSARNFSRVFFRETGLTPAKYVERCRVEQARRKLERTDMPIEELAEHAGFGNADSMRRAFLKHLKTTPGLYRRNFRSAFYTELPA